MSSHGSGSSRRPSSASDDVLPNEMVRARRFTATTEDGLFFIPGEYRLSGETSCYPWVHVHAGLCIVTRDTGFAPGSYDVRGTVKYDTHEELEAVDPKFSSRRWSRLGVAGEHYSGRVECVPVELMGVPVKMVHEVDDPQATDPHATHKYHMAGFTVVKKRRTDVPGLTLVVKDKLPVRNKYHVEGRVVCQVGSTELRGMSLIPLRRTNVGRFRLNGKVYLSLSTGADATPLPPPTSSPDQTDDDFTDDQDNTTPRRSPQARVVAESCKCRPKSH